MHYKANTGSKGRPPLLLGVFSILILLVTVDIYLSILLPKSCSLTFQRIVTDHGFYGDHEQEEQQQTDGIAIEELLDIQHHDGQSGIIFHEIRELEDLNHEGDEVWDKLFPPSGGYLFQGFERNGITPGALGYRHVS